MTAKIIPFPGIPNPSILKLGVRIDILLAQAEHLTIDEKMRHVSVALSVIERELELCIRNAEHNLRKVRDKRRATREKFKELSRRVRETDTPHIPA